MKTKMSVVLAASVLALGLAACGDEVKTIGGNEENAAAPTAAQTTETAPEAGTTDTAANTEQPAAAGYAFEISGVSLYPELCGQEPNAKDLVLVHFNPLWPTTPSPKASRYAMDNDYAYFWDGRIYNYREDPEFRHPLRWDQAPAELQARLQPLKERVDRMADFYPDKPGAPRKFPYKTFYDFAPPQNPF